LSRIVLTRSLMLMFTSSLNESNPALVAADAGGG
jgi:hypothetical protein